MNRSYIHSSATGQALSTARSQENCADHQPKMHRSQGDQPDPGSLNDSALVRSILVEAMRKAPISRAGIADRMTLYAGVTVTERMLSAFAAESRDDVRWPAELDRAFCAAVGDNRLLTCRAELAGLAFVDETGLELMELGREFLRQKRAAAKIASLETRLAGVEL